MQPLDLQECTVPHIKGLIHICLEQEVHGCGTTTGFMLDQSTPISYHTEAFVETEVVCHCTTMAIPLTLLTRGLPKCTIEICLNSSLKTLCAFTVNSNQMHRCMHNAHTDMLRERSEN